jgi:hypothetical protein
MRELQAKGGTREHATVGAEDVSVGRTINSDGCSVLGTY